MRTLPKDRQSNPIANNDADVRRAADLAGITMACKEAYANASREGYADNPTVIAAVAALKEAHAALVLADADFTAAKDLLNTGAKGFFITGISFIEVTRATWRADRATRAAAAAYARLRAVIMQAGDENDAGGRQGDEAPFLTGMAPLDRREAPMAFWKRPIELPQAFYQAAGECILDYLKSDTMARKLAVSSAMTFDQAIELLDRVKECAVRLRALLAQYPMNSGASFETQEKRCEEDIQVCEKKKEAILAISDFERSLPIRLYGEDINGQDATYFERGVLGTAKNFFMDHMMTFKLVAKCANISSGDFHQHAVDTFKETPRGKLVLAEAQAAPRWP